MGFRHFLCADTQADRAWAEWIAQTLQEDEHHILVQPWDSGPGTNRVHDLRAGTRDRLRPGQADPGRLRTALRGASRRPGPGADRQLTPTALEDTAWLLDRAATYLQARGRFAEAKALHERVLE